MLQMSPLVGKSAIRCNGPNTLQSLANFFDSHRALLSFTISVQVTVLTWAERML